MLLPDLSAWASLPSHHMHQVQGEDLDTADNSREGTDYCGTNGEPTDTEEEVLEKERQGEERSTGLGRGKPHVCKEEGIRNGMFTLRAPRASSQVELRATFSSCPHSGQGLCRGIGGQHTQTFPSCVGVEGQPGSEQTQGSLSLPLTSWFQLPHLKSHRGAFSEVLSQLGILTGENGASHA